jgi:creatinine amidohydrolase
VIPAKARRHYGRRTAPEVDAGITHRSILCLPIGSIEQHGAHLPLNTDTVIAEKFAAALAEHVRDRHDLWVLPAVPFGLSLEHAWSPGTVSLRITTFVTLVQALVAEYVGATSARKLIVVNGHGGNRGVLEPLLYEIEHTLGISTCVLHPFSLSTVPVGGALPDIHAGIGETSVMLALAPDEVRLDLLPGDGDVDPGQAEAIGRQIRDRGVTWPWSSGQPDVATGGVIGDPRGTNAELCRSILHSALEAASAALDRLDPSKQQTDPTTGRTNATD